MDAWTVGWMDGWMDGWRMDGCMHGLLDDWVIGSGSRVDTDYTISF